MESVKNYKELLRYFHSDICELILLYSRTPFLTIDDSSLDFIHRGEYYATFVYFGAISLERVIFKKDFEQFIDGSREIYFSGIDTTCQIKFHDGRYTDIVHAQFDYGDDVEVFCMRELLTKYQIEDVVQAFDYLGKTLRNILKTEIVNKK